MEDVYELTDSETVLSDDYPVYPAYVYIADRTFRRCPIKGTVGQWKRQSGFKEIRRADLFAHPGAKIGDGVIGKGEK